MFIGSDPGKLAISHDSSSIYVVLDGAPMIRRFDTASQTPALAFALDDGTFAQDIAVAPGHPETIAVSRRTPGTPPHYSVAIYDNGVKRPAEIADNSGSNVIEFSAAASTLYGINNETSEFPFRTMSVDSVGVTVTSLQPQLIVGSDTDIQFVDRRIYSTNGQVVDPVRQTLVGTFPLPANIMKKGMVADSALRRAFSLLTDATSIQILAFDIHTFAQTGSMTLPNVGSVEKIGSLVRWGANGLAFRTENQVVTFEIPEHWIVPARPSRDFDGNGKSDVLWRDPVGNVSMWLMSGNVIAGDSLVGNPPGSSWTLSEAGDFDPSRPSNLLISSWTLSGTGDFDASGEADILWRSPEGDVHVWLMNGTVAQSGGFVGNVWIGWTIVGTGDFNGDGKADILWRDPGGAVAIWLMNGTSVSSDSIIATVWSDWKIAGTGDFNGDGKSDILWRDSAGNVALWMMNGLNTISEVIIANIWPSWAIAGTGDFNGDGKTDILWREASGSVAIWLMDGNAITSSTGIANIWPSWDIVGTGDYNGDGKADILWRESFGSVSVWLMDGTRVLSQTGMGQVSQRKPVASIN